MTRLRRRENVTGWALAGPATLHLVVFAIFPIAYAAYVSTFKWNLATSAHRFAGLNNYLLSLREDGFWNALWNSFRYTAVSVPAGMALALAVALLVNQRLRGVTIFRTLYYIPAISSGVATAMLWIYVFLPENGLVNAVLGWLHISNKTDFFNNAATAMWALVTMSVFTGLGPRMVLYLAGLVGIPTTLYEAAALDGATGWRAFRKITLPMLLPTSLFVLVTSTIAAMQLFTPVYMITKGGPDRSTDVVGYHIYTEAWIDFNVGLASAKSFIVLGVIALISVIQFRLTQANLADYSA